jgi:uncharacterized delta-60 repeat protein
MLSSRFNSIHKRSAPSIVLKRLLAIFAISMLLVSWLPLRQADAADGALDPSFGSGGFVTTDFGDGSATSASPRAVAIQPDGKIVVAGDDSSQIVLVRYNPDGTLDAAFGNGGIVTTKSGGPPFLSSAVAVVLQPDRKIVVAGRVPGSGATGSKSGFGIARYNPDGSLDTSFGDGGEVRTDFGIPADARAMVLQPDGKMIVAGGVQSGFFNGFALARYNSNGSLDPSFGSGGTVITTNFTASNLSGLANALTLQADGKIVAAGTFGRPPSLFVPLTTDGFALVRYNANGTLDPTFGNGGKVTTVFNSNEQATGVAFQPDGKIVASGGTSPPGVGKIHFALARYNADGSLDPTFGACGSGKVTTDIESHGNDTASNFTLQPDGKIILADGFDGFVLARYNPNGSLDTSFGAGGEVISSAGGLVGGIRAIALQRDGKIVAVAAAYNLDDSAHRVWTVARYQNTIITPASTFQFSQSSYSTPNASSSTAITVTRTGDTSQPASVDYSTLDGTATQKSNFTIPLGTLSFAAGETSKTFSLLTSKVGFAGTKSATLVLSNPQNASLGAQATAQLQITDNQTKDSSTNPIDDPTTYVAQHYHDFLNREADPSGLQFWIGQITSCNGDANCIDIKRQNVSAAYFLSREFQETGFFVIKVQRVAFGKLSSDATKRICYLQFLKDAQAVGHGFVDLQPGADQVLEQNKTNYAQAVAASGDFIAKYPTTLSASQFVDALYQTADVQPQGTERQDAITAFGSGDTAGRAAALRKVAESASVKQAEFNSAFVLLQYFGYLRRNPTDPPDKNDNGYQFWLSKLNQANGDYIASQMVRSFIISLEYRKRFGSQ